MSPNSVRAKAFNWSNFWHAFYVFNIPYLSFRTYFYFIIRLSLYNDMLIFKHIFFFISPDFVTQRNFFVGSSAHLFDKFKRGGHKGLQYCGIGQFFLRYFGNFNLEMRYRGVRQTCGMRFSFSILHGIKIILQVLQVFRAFSSFPLDIPNET